MIQLKSFMVNCFGENCYLLSDETKEAVIIDCGSSTPGEEQKISSFIADQQLVLKHHLCTHVHGDHLLGAHFIYTKYGLLPEAGAADIEQMPGIREQARLFGLPVPPEDLPFGRALRDGDRITFGHSELQVLAVPGHSPEAWPSLLRTSSSSWVMPFLPAASDEVTSGEEAKSS